MERIGSCRSRLQVPGRPRCAAGATPAHPSSGDRLKRQFIAVKFDQLLAIVADEPVFETGLLLAAAVCKCPADRVAQRARRPRTQAPARAVRAGTATPPHRHTAPHPFLVAN